MADRVIILDVRRAGENLRARDLVQMCVGEETRIMMSDDLEIYKKASDVIIGDKVCGIDEAGNIKDGVVRKIWNSKGNSKLIEFCNGTSLILSNHPLKTWDGNWISSDKIKVEDKVQCIQKTLFRSEYLTLKGLFLEAAKKCQLYVRLNKEDREKLRKCDKSFFDWVKPKSVSKIKKNGIIPIEKAKKLNANINFLRSKNGVEFSLEDLDEDSFSWILGFIFSDGNIKYSKTHSLFRIQQVKEDYICAIEDALRKSKIKYQTYKSKKQIKTVYVNSYPLVSILNELKITPNKTRSLDLSSFDRLNVKTKANMISGIIDGDGHIGKKTNMVRICSASEKAALKIKDWLLEIGSYSSVKKEDGDGHVFGYACDTTHWNVTINKTHVINLKAVLNYSLKLNQIPLEIKKDSRPRKNDCFYTKIKSITSLGKKNLINFSVDPIETFICENIVTHNCGRAGRMHGQEEADVHIILERGDLVKWQKILDNPGSFEVRSNFNDVSVFAFHVISQVVRGEIHNKESFSAWYDFTLDKYQRENRGEKIPSYESIAQELHDTGTAQYDPITSEIKAKPLGKICATYYFSPYDVRDWFYNIHKLFKKDLLWNDSCQAWALANIESAREWENDTLKIHTSALCDNIESRGLSCRGGILSRLLAIDCDLHGRRPKCDLPIFYSVKSDMPRVLSAIEAICMVSKRVWGDQSNFINTLQLRHKYGVPSAYAKIVSLEGIGKSTAQQLHDVFNISSEKELIERFDSIYEEASSGVKRSLTKYKKSKESGVTSSEPKVSYKADRRITRGRDEFE